MVTYNRIRTLRKDRNDIIISSTQPRVTVSGNDCKQILYWYNICIYVWVFIRTTLPIYTIRVSRVPLCKYERPQHWIQTHYVFDGIIIIFVVSKF